MLEGLEGVYGRFCGAAGFRAGAGIGAEVDQREESVSAMQNQVGGDHYRKMAIQPIEYILANDLGFVDGAVVKYVSRWKEKGGIEDLEKARHLLAMLIEHARAQPND